MWWVVWGVGVERGMGGGDECRSQGMIIGGGHEEWVAPEGTAPTGVSACILADKCMNCCVGWLVQGAKVQGAMQVKYDGDVGTTK